MLDMYTFLTLVKQTGTLNSILDQGHSVADANGALRRAFERGYAEFEDTGIQVTDAGREFLNYSLPPQNTAARGIERWLAIPVEVRQTTIPSGAVYLPGSKWTDDGHDEED